MMFRQYNILYNGSNITPLLIEGKLYPFNYVRK